ncbi:MAG: hypothetical protein U0Q22_18440 [Acidimicrobiales bacterium]
MTTTIPLPHRRRARTGLALLAATLLGTACFPETPTPGPTTTTAPTTTTPSNVVSLTDASLEWTVSREADHGTFAPGQVNYWSAGESDSTQATYVPTSGNATVLKKNASGTYVPIGSEPAVGWANRGKDGLGVNVSATSANYLGQKVRFTGGTGTLDRTTGASTIQWTGTFSINFYGQYVPFWIKNPKLVVNASGVGQITATVAGFASSLDDPTTRTPLPATAVVIADLPVVNGANSTGFTAATAYGSTSVTPPAPAGPQVAKTAANGAYWGSWPQTFVNFQAATGLGTYWYTSGGSTDNQKPQEPVTVAYRLVP